MTGSLRVRVTVTVETDRGRESASSTATTVVNDMALGEAMDFASNQAKRRVQQLYQRINATSRVDR